MGAETKRLLSELAVARQETLALLEGLADDQLDARNERGRSVRGFLQGMVDHDLEHVQHLIRARRGAGSRRTEVHRMIAELEAARGELLGTLAALDDEALDKDWEEGEWPIRKILEHLIETERNYIGRGVGGIIKGG